MQLNEALESVSKIYVPGTIEFYNQMKNDPWQEAHDVFEGQLVIHRGTEDYFNRMSLAGDWFYKTIKGLIEIYSKLNPEQTSFLDIGDALAIGNEDRLRQLEAMRANFCSICESKEDIRVTTHRAKGAGIYCTKCVQ